MSLCLGHATVHLKERVLSSKSGAPQSYCFCLSLLWQNFGQHQSGNVVRIDDMSSHAKLKSSEISVYSDTNQLARPLLFMIQRNKRNGPNSSSLKLQCVRSKSGQEQRQSQCLGPQMGWTNIESICDEEHI